MWVYFLGTAAARPSVARNVSSLLLRREGEVLMFDCGEGTQRQMMRFGTGFGVRDIFFSHLHADHFLGVVGLVLTLALQDRREPLDLWAPDGSEGTLRDALSLGTGRLPFEVGIHGLEPGQLLDRGSYAVEPFPTLHGPRSLGYAVVESPRPGRFAPDRARALDIPEGPLWGQLHRGKVIELAGRTVGPEQVVGPPRPGRRVVYTGDTRPCAATARAAAGADLLIHEATFGEDEAERARSTRHSTAREAAEVAAEAGALRLALTHFSPRYAADARALEREARAVFHGTFAAYDGLEVEVPLQELRPGG